MAFLFIDLFIYWGLLLCHFVNLFKKDLHMTAEFILRHLPVFCCYWTKHLYTLSHWVLLIYRRYVDFGMVILYQKSCWILLLVLIMACWLFWIFRDHIIYKSGSVIPSFLILIPLLFPFHSTILLARTTINCSVRVGRRGYIAFFLDLSG